MLQALAAPLYRPRPCDKRADDDGKPCRRARPRDPAVALCRRRFGAGDGAGRRRDAAYGIRPLDHRVEAGHGHAAALVRGRLAGRVRKISGHSAIPRAQCRHEPRCVQDDLLVGMDASSARPADRRGVSAAVCLVSVARLGRAGAAAAALVHFRAWRAAGRGRLVDGCFRPCRAHRSLAIPAGDASHSRLRDLRGTDLDRAAAFSRSPCSACRGGQGRGPSSRWRHCASCSGAGADLSRRARRRLARRLRLQHLAADRRRAGAGCRAAVFCNAAVAEFLRESSHRAVRPPHAGLCDLRLCGASLDRRRA